MCKFKTLYDCFKQIYFSFQITYFLWANGQRKGGYRNDVYVGVFVL